MAINPFTWKPDVFPTTQTNQTPTNPSSMSDIDRLYQVMQGNLAGQLDTGDKLSALSALMRSVSRGRTQTPDQVMKQITQDKATELQNKIQLDVWKRNAEQAALAKQYRQQLINQEQDPQMKSYLQFASDKAIEDLYLERVKGQKPNLGQWSENLQRFIPKDRPVPTRSGRLPNGSSVTEYSNGDKLVTYANGTQQRFDVEGNPING